MSDAVTHAPDGSGPGAEQAGDLVPLREATRTWFAISLQTFGGPAGQIAVMQRALVDGKRWIGQQRFLHALNYCMLLPGPEAQQLAIYIGWLLNGVRGGLIAGILFVLPGMLALLALSAIYVGFGDTTAVTALFAGLAPAVLAIVAQAVWRVGSRALGHPALVGVAVAAFVALAAFAVPFPVVVAAAGLIGWLLGRFLPDAVRTRTSHGAADGPPPVVPDDALHHDAPSGRRAARILAAGLLLWATPVVAVALFTGFGSTLTRQGLFFSGAALVTFGGAYAVLAYVAQQAVETYGWLSARDMVRGLALAETTPGPLIMVVQFVAFLGAYHHPGGLNPWLAAVLGSLLTTWVTFVPCFLFIFLGAPYVERLRGNHTLSAALTGITAAVVGVIANLALYFAVHTIFATSTPWVWGPLRLDLPQVDSVRPVAALLAAVAFALVFVLRWSVLRTLAVCSALGLAAGSIRRLAVELLARTGMRKGELLGLTVDAVVQIGSAFWLRTPVGKMRTDRYIPLHPAAKALIDDWVAQRADWQASDRLFTDRARPIPPTRVDKAVQRAAAAAALGHVHPHQLRHTLATQAINRGMSLEVIAALLGHKTMTMTMVYANPRELHQTGGFVQVA